MMSTIHSFGLTGTRGKVTTVCHRQCCLYPPDLVQRQEGFGRRRECCDARPWFWHIPFRHLVFCLRRRSVHWSRYPTKNDRKYYRRCQGIYDSCRWRAVPYGAAECRYQTTLWLGCNGIDNRFRTPVSTSKKLDVSMGLLLVDVGAVDGSI